MFDLGEYQAGDTVTISNNNAEEIGFSVYKLNYDAVQAAYETLSENKFELDSYNDTSVNGHIDMQEDGRLIFSIPSERGWSLYVDGEKNDIEDFEDTFISVHLDKGGHEISLKYETPGLKPGAMVSGACVILFIISAALKKYIAGKHKLKTIEDEKDQGNNEING